MRSPVSRKALGEGFAIINRGLGPDQVDFSHLGDCGLRRSRRPSRFAKSREKLFVVVPLAVLIFFIAGLLYLLCLEHVDTLGAYSIPSKTGLLIPSVYSR
jgi:hypothetical protein